MSCIEWLEFGSSTNLDFCAQGQSIGSTAIVTYIMFVLESLRLLFLSDVTSICSDVHVSQEPRLLKTLGV